MLVLFMKKTVLLKIKKFLVRVHGFTFWGQISLMSDNRRQLCSHVYCCIQSVVTCCFGSIYKGNPASQRYIIGKGRTRQASWKDLRDPKFLEPYC